MEANCRAYVEFNRSHWEHISSDCKDVIYRMLERDPKNRISYEDILQH